MNCIFLITAIVFISLIKVIINYYKNVFNYWKKRNVNGPLPLPIFGNFISILLKPANEVEEQRLLKYGRIYGTFEFSVPILTIADPSLIREVSIKQFHNFRNRYNRLSTDKFLCKSLFFTSNWKTLRGNLSPVFTRSKMKTLFRRIDECTENAIDYIRSNGDKEVDLKNAMLSFTTDVFLSFLFGVKTNGFKDQSNDLLLRARQLSKVNFWRILASFAIPNFIKELYEPLQFPFIGKEAWDFFLRLLTLIKSQQKICKVRNTDFFSLMISKSEDSENEMKKCLDSPTHQNYIKNVGKKMENEDILAQALIFFIAGNESTSTILNFILYSLAMNPEIQEKLYNEIKKCLRDRDELDIDYIHALHYLNAVVNESLRMYPPILFFDRIAAEDIVLGNGSVIIEKGTVVNLPFYAIQHDPEFFPEPHKFKPDRFMPENKHLVEPYTFIPFGVGPRNCIGMRFTLMVLKIFLIKLVKQFEILRTKNTAVTPKYSIVIRALESKPLIAAFAARKA